jgi:hypothetical protein
VVGGDIALSPNPGIRIDQCIVGSVDNTAALPVVVGIDRAVCIFVGKAAGTGLTVGIGIGIALALAPVRGNNHLTDIASCEGHIDHIRPGNIHHLRSYSLDLKLVHNLVVGIPAGAVSGLEAYIRSPGMKNSPELVLMFEVWFDNLLVLGE